MTTETPRYNAFFKDDHSRIVYRNRTEVDTLADLPDNAVPSTDARSTYYRNDGGDRFEFAMFETDQGQTIVIQRMN